MLFRGVEIDVFAVLILALVCVPRCAPEAGRVSACRESEPSLIEALNLYQAFLDKV